MPSANAASRAAASAGAACRAASPALPEGLRFGQFVLGRRVGKGNFSSVHAAHHVRTNERVAIKLETEGARRPKLLTEAAVYRDLSDAPGFARMRWFGRAHGHLALVVDRLGPSLRTAHRLAGQRLGLDAVGSVGEQVLQRLEEMHGRGWVHADIKPANLLLPPPLSGQSAAAAASAARIGEGLFCIDFGLSRLWRAPSVAPAAGGAGAAAEGGDGAMGGGAAHLRAAPARRRGAVGTIRFASVSNQEGTEPLGRSDDLEALAYMLVHLRFGVLPWSGVRAPTKPERFAAMLESKRRTSDSELRAAGGFGAAFDEFLSVARTPLPLEARPPYEVLRGLLRDATRGERLR